MSKQSKQNEIMPSSSSNLPTLWIVGNRERRESFRVFRLSVGSTGQEGLDQSLVAVQAGKMKSRVLSTDRHVNVLRECRVDNGFGNFVLVQYDLVKEERTDRLVVRVRSLDFPPGSTIDPLRAAIQRPGRDRPHRI